MLYQPLLYSGQARSFQRVKKPPSRQPLSLAYKELHEVVLLFAPNLTSCFRCLCFSLSCLPFQVHCSSLPSTLNLISQNKKLPHNFQRIIQQPSLLWIVCVCVCFTFSTLLNSLKNSSAHYNKYLGHGLL